MTESKTTPRPLRECNLAIVGPYNNIWTGELFSGPADAYAKLNSFWGEGKWNPDKWKVIEAELIITPAVGATPCPLE